MKRTKRIAAALLALLLLSACAETPKEDIVTSKGGDALESIIEGSAGNGIEWEEQVAAVPQHARDVFADKDGIVSFCFDADVLLPNIEAVPVFEVRPHFFTAQEAERIARAAWGDAEIYEYAEVLSRKELEEMILEAKQGISDPDALLEKYGGDAEMADSVTATINERIASMERDLLTAPEDESVHKLSDFQFHPDSYYTTGNSGDYLFGVPAIEGLSSIKCTAKVEDVPYFLWVSMRDDPSWRTSNLYLYPYSLTNPVNQFNYFQRTPLTDEEQVKARETAEQFLVKMDMGMFLITDQEPVQSTLPDGDTAYAIRFECVPVYSALALTPLAGDDLYLTEQYKSTYADTRLWFFVSYGRVMSVNYEAPLEIVQTINENVLLLPFTEALEKVKDALPLKYTPTYLKAKTFADRINYVELIRATVNVAEIQFSYARTLIKNNQEDFSLMPVWIVYGNECLNEYTFYGRRTTNDTPALEREILLVINAVDGSVVNIEQGY